MMNDTQRTWIDRLCCSAAADDGPYHGSLGAAAQEQVKVVVETRAEKVLSVLPEGADLEWHVEMFATLEEAKAGAIDTVFC